jgi:hypothetical protein
LRHLGGPDKIRGATDAALLAIAGVGPRHVRALRTHFGTAPTSATDGTSNAEEPTEEGLVSRDSPDDPL